MLSTKELMTVPIRPLVDRTYLEQVLLSRFSHGEVQQWVQKYFQPYRELMSYYRCAIMEVETKFNVLNEELSLQYDRNPIETIKTRLKSPESIMEKLTRRGYPLTVESIEKNLLAPCRHLQTLRGIFAPGRHHTLRAQGLHCKP